MLEQAVRVEAARLSLIKPLVETNKICATKDLNDDELDDLMERSRSILVRTDYLEPFQERCPLSYTQTAQDRVSPSRSVGTVTPTNDLSVVPSEVEIPLDTADTVICDILFEEEMISPAKRPEVTQPSAPIFNSSDLFEVEDNLPEAILEIEDLEAFSISPTDIEVELYKAVEAEIDLRECEDDIIKPQRVPEVHRPTFDSSDLLEVEDNLPEDISAIEDHEVFSISPTNIEQELYKASEVELDLRECEDDIIEPVPDREVRRPPLNTGEERSSSPLILDECFVQPQDVEAANLTPVDVDGMAFEKADVVEEDIYFIEEEEFVMEASVELQQLMKMVEQEMMQSEERCISPFTDENFALKLIPVDDDLLTLELQDYMAEPLVYAKIDEADVYYYEEETVCMEAMVELQQSMKMFEQEMMQSQERSVSPFTDENFALKPIPADVDLLTLEVQDYVTEPLVYAKIDEADVYYFEEETMCMDVVCDLTQISRMIQHDLVLSEERPVSPVQDEALFLEPLLTDVELVSIDGVYYVEEPLNRAKVEECDLYYYEEETFSVDVVCDFTRLIEHSTASFSVEERVRSETVHLESSATEMSSTRPSEITPTRVDVAATNRSSETFVLPQVRDGQLLNNLIVIY